MQQRLSAALGVGTKTIFSRTITGVLVVVHLPLHGPQIKPVKVLAVRYILQTVRTRLGLSTPGEGQIVEAASSDPIYENQRMHSVVDSVLFAECL